MYKTTERNGFYFSVPIFSPLIGFSRWSYRVLASSPENVLFVLGIIH